MGKNNPLNGMFGAFGPTFTVVGTIAMIVALILWATTILPTDLETTRIGYLASPTVKVNGENVATALSALIFSLQIIGMFGLLRSENNKRSRIFAVVALGSLLYDIYTDMMAKFPTDLATRGLLYIALNNSSLFVSSFLETALIFTLMSEILASLLIEELFSIFPDFVKSLGITYRQVSAPLSAWVHDVFGDSDYRPGQQPDRYRNGGSCVICGAPTTNGKYCKRHELERQAQNQRQQQQQKKGQQQQRSFGNAFRDTEEVGECPRCGSVVPYGTKECRKCHTQFVWED